MCHTMYEMDYSAICFVSAAALTKFPLLQINRLLVVGRDAVDQAKSKVR